MTGHPECSDAWELVDGELDGHLLLSCEHASNRLPAGWSWSEQDEWLIDSHWAYDPGAAELTREIAAKTKAPALLARFSRLLVDPNRPPASATLIRRIAEGRSVALNASLTLEDRARRLAYWEAFHGRLNRLCRDSSAPVVLALHSFTKEYEGQLREDLEVGVLYDEAEAAAQRLAQSIGGLGLNVRLNEPYSGKDGMIYSADRHARATGKLAVEIEVRQDLALDEAFRAELVKVVADTASWVTLG